jgi:hypothetical protein
MTKFDKILINGSVFIINLLWMIYLIDNIAVSVFIALLLSILFNRLGVHILNRKDDKSKISISEMENLLSLYGIDYQIDLILSAIPNYFNPIQTDYGVILTLNCEQVQIFTNYKYNSCSMEDIAKFYRTAKKNGISTAYILSRQNPRNILVLATSLDIKFTFITSKQLHKKLYNHNLLMENIKPVKEKQKVKLSEILAEIFQRKRAKYFFICALILSLSCIITPYKIYYMIITSIVASFGIACILKKA